MAQKTSPPDNLLVQHKGMGYAVGDVIPRTALVNNGVDHVRLGAVVPTTMPVTCEFTPVAVAADAATDEVLAENARLQAIIGKANVELGKLKEDHDKANEMLVDLEKQLQAKTNELAATRAELSEEIKSLRKSQAK